MMIDNVNDTDDCRGGNDDYCVTIKMMIVIMTMRII